METKKIEAKNLEKQYVLKEKTGLFRSKNKKIVQAVKGVSLEIPKGKIVGVLGINGAGKTTTIRMLASIIEPTAGEITMNGIDAVKNHLWVKERINVVSGGERNLYWRLTASENLKYFGSLYGVKGMELKEKIARLLKLVGLEEVADIPVERYSKGMKQRLQIARGLINDPEYIFLDEPTLGLDIVIAKEIRKVIHELAKKDDKGILLTTHYISEAEELCDYIYILDNGKIIAQGTKEELKELFNCKPKVVLQEPGLEEMIVQIPLYKIKHIDSAEIRQRILSYVDIATAFIFDTSGGNGIEHDVEKTLEIILPFIKVFSDKTCIAGGLNKNNVFSVTQKVLKKGILCAVDAQSSFLQKGIIHYENVAGFLVQYNKSLQEINGR